MVVCPRLLGVLKTTTAVDIGGGVGAESQPIDFD
jgi:hypothetical protein